MSNDLQTISGITGTTKELVESWKLDQTCAVVSSPFIDESNPCAGHAERHEWAAAECELINTPGETNPFSKCIQKLDAMEIAKSHVECLYDACNCDRGGDCECLCRLVTFYSEYYVAPTVQCFCLQKA